MTFVTLSLCHGRLRFREQLAQQRPMTSRLVLAVAPDGQVRARRERGEEREETRTITVTPDHWPEGCGGVGYKLRITPDDGKKMVKTGDIFVTCDSGHPYYTGVGSERIYVTRELTVAKRSGEPVQIVMRRTDKGVELVELK